MWKEKMNLIEAVKKVTKSSNLYFNLSNKIGGYLDIESIPQITKLGWVQVRKAKQD